MITREQSYKHTPYFDTVIVLYLRKVIIKPLDQSATWYKEGRIIFSDNSRVVMWEQGFQVEYAVEFRKRRNIRNTPGGLRSLEEHARAIGGRQIHFYDPQKPKKQNFLFKKVLV